MKFLALVMLLVCAPTFGMPECSGEENFRSSIYGMLLSELSAINIDSPEHDAKIRYKKGDYRLMGYGLYSGIKIPGVEKLEKNEVCEYGVRVFPGMTDAFESPAHRRLVGKLKVYIKKYNARILQYLEERRQ